MGSWISTTLTDEVKREIHQLHEETAFTEYQLKRLHYRFIHLDRDKKGYLTKRDLMLIPEIAINPLAEKIINAFILADSQSTDLEAASPIIGEEVMSVKCDFRHFVLTMARFQRFSHHKQSSHPLSSDDKKIEFVFKVYDVDCDGKISKSDLASILGCLLGRNVPEDDLQCIINRTMKEADQDKDDFLDLKEFKKALGSIDINGSMSVRFPTA